MRVSRVWSGYDEKPPFCRTDDFHALSRASRPSCNQLRKSSSAASQSPVVLSGRSVAVNLRGDWFQHLVMMQAAETGVGNDAMSGW